MKTIFIALFLTVGFFVNAEVRLSEQEKLTAKVNLIEATLRDATLRDATLRDATLIEANIPEEVAKGMENAFYLFAKLVGKEGEWHPHEPTVTVGEVLDFIAEVSGINFIIELLDFSEESEYSKEDGFLCPWGHLYNPDHKTTNKPKCEDISKKIAGQTEK